MIETIAEPTLPQLSIHLGNVPSETVDCCDRGIVVSTKYSMYWLALQYPLLGRNNLGNVKSYQR